MKAAGKAGGEKIFAQVGNLLNIGIALSAEKDRDRLLEMIVTEARRITAADDGTLYLKEGGRLELVLRRASTTSSSWTC